MPPVISNPWPDAPPARPQLPSASRRLAAGALRPLVRGGLLVVLLVLTGETLRITLGSNFHTVVPERCYRSAQPSATSLGRTIHAHGVRTVINLRGQNDGETWYQEEAVAIAEAGAALVSLDIR